MWVFKLGFVEKYGLRLEYVRVLIDLNQMTKSFTKLFRACIYKLLGIWPENIFLVCQILSFDVNWDIDKKSLDLTTCNLTEFMGENFVSVRIPKLLCIENNF